MDSVQFSKLKEFQEKRVCVDICALTPVAHVTPASDVTVGVWGRKLVAFRQTHGPDEVRLLHLDTTQHLTFAQHTNLICTCIKVLRQYFYLNHRGLYLAHILLSTEYMCAYV